MDNQLNEKLIQAIRKQLPQGSNLALALMDILSIGKEAAYRRLRGDVMFTFEDVAKLSRKLGVSLDKVVGESKALNDDKWVFMNMGTLYPSYLPNHTEQYSKKLKVLLEIFHNIQDQPGAILRCATHHIPYYFIILYPKLTLFRHYRSAYLSDGINTRFHFSDMTVLPEVHEIEKQLLKKCLEIPKHLLILDRNAFSSTVKDIQYFYQRRLISEDERIQLKKELLDIISYIENITATGKFNTGAEISIYLSDVCLETSYAHLESDSFENSLQLTYFIDVLSFYNPIICQIQKDWIESLKRYSTLITQTGEMQRTDFFNEQKELIEAFI